MLHSPAKEVTAAKELSPTANVLSPIPLAPSIADHLFQLEFSALLLIDVSVIQLVALQLFVQEYS